jgi:hypothetical protein
LLAVLLPSGGRPPAACNPHEEKTVPTALEQDVETCARRPPLSLHWSDPANPLPLRRLRALAANTPPMPGREAPPWLATGPHGQPFDFCGHVRRLCEEIIRHCPELAHVDTGRILFTVIQARSCRRHGLQARVTPLRCRDGSLTRRRGGIAYQVQRYFASGREVLYLMTFCLPRFLDQDFDEKFITLFHELYHLSPEFNGDLRRHGGRGKFHSDSKREYDAHMADLARAYLASGPDPALHDFLRLNFAQLAQRHGSVVGVMVPRPKLVPLDGDDAPAGYMGSAATPQDK